LAKTMQIHSSIPELRAALQRVAVSPFVPTMGNLHAGHIALMTRGARHGNIGGRQHFRQSPAVRAQ
jgi:pantothenate synthetase